jgi:hypothetical protein
MFTCVRCNGEGGSRLEDEYGRPEHIVCFHCHGTGKVNDEMMEHDRKDMMVEFVAAQMTYRQEEAAKQNETGEDWSFHAAEAGTSLRAYRDDRYWINRQSVIKLLKEADVLFVNALVDLLAPAVEPIIEPVKVVAPVINDEDVPF